MKRVLVLDPTQEFQEHLFVACGSQYEFVIVSSCSEATKKLGNEVFDIILTDVDFPDGDGFSFCSKVKNHEILRWVPVIFLSKKNSIHDKIQAFKVGADDFISKPFDPYELSLRMEARLRNLRPTSEGEANLQRGSLILSVQFQKAFLPDGQKEKDLKLTPTEFRLLYYFVKNEGVVVTRGQLLATVWAGNDQVLSRTIDKHISTLKKKLAFCSGYIQSVHSRGYRFAIEEDVQKKTVEAASAVF